MDPIIENIVKHSISEEDLDGIKDKMRKAALYAHNYRISIENLSPDHHELLLNAIQRTISTEDAQFTFAQIIDGLPTEDVSGDSRSPGIFGFHPIEEHVDLCPGCMEAAREFCDSWRPSDLRFDSHVVQQYQNAEPGSKRFALRLLELVAVALHQLGVMLFKNSPHLHQGDIEAVLYAKQPYIPPTGVIIHPRPTMFNHHHYLDDDVYPEGVADMVGYWVENRILGGVVIFDRKIDSRPPEDTSGEAACPDDELPNAYLHTSRDRKTDRPWQLNDEKQQRLLDFLLSPSPSPSPSSTPSDIPIPIPMLPEKTDNVRVDWWLATFRRIYRDLWERMPLLDWELQKMERRPRGEVDYPEIREHLLHALDVWEKGKAADKENPRDGESDLSDKYPPLRWG